PGGFQSALLMRLENAWQKTQCFRIMEAFRVSSGLTLSPDSNAVNCEPSWPLHPSNWALTLERLIWFVRSDHLVRLQSRYSESGDPDIGSAQNRRAVSSQPPVMSSSSVLP